MELNAHTSDSELLGELGNRVRETRLSHNLTQDQLADEAGISRDTVIRLEAGSAVMLTALIRVMRVLGLLERFESLVPQALPSPIQQVEMQGKRRRRARKSSPKEQLSDDKQGDWRWNSP